MGKANNGQLRIIGGAWRGRKLRFPDVPGLRPTPDRVRETLFNWLSHDITGANCLDLYAGSGALGLEALSRGAQQCCFVDTSRTALEAIRQHLQLLECSHGRCHQADASALLVQPPAQAVDIVFLDPPFNADLLAPTASALEQQGWLSPNALIYIESARQEADPQLPPNWEQHRDKIAGEVRYRLYHRQ